MVSSQRDHWSSQPPHGFGCSQQARWDSTGNRAATSERRADRTLAEHTVSCNSLGQGLPRREDRVQDCLLLERLSDAWSRYILGVVSVVSEQFFDRFSSCFRCNMAVIREPTRHPRLSSYPQFFFTIFCWEYFCAFLQTALNDGLSLIFYYTPAVQESVDAAAEVHSKLRIHQIHSFPNREVPDGVSLDLELSEIKKLLNF